MDTNVVHTNFVPVDAQKTHFSTLPPMSSKSGTLALEQGGGVCGWVWFPPLQCTALTTSGRNSSRQRAFWVLVAYCRQSPPLQHTALAESQELHVVAWSPPGLALWCRTPCSTQFLWPLGCRALCLTCGSPLECWESHLLAQSQLHLA